MLYINSAVKFAEGRKKAGKGGIGGEGGGGRRGYMHRV